MTGQVEGGEVIKGAKVCCGVQDQPNDDKVYLRPEALTLKGSSTIYTTLVRYSSHALLYRDVSQNYLPRANSHRLEYAGVT